MTSHLSLKNLLKRQVKLLLENARQFICHTAGRQLRYFVPNVLLKLGARAYRILVVFIYEGQYATGRVEVNRA